MLEKKIVFKSYLIPVGLHIKKGGGTSLIVMKSCRASLISLYMYILSSYSQRRVFSLQLLVIPLRKAPRRV